MKFLRGTPFDPFGYMKERKHERQLISEYETTIEALLRNLTRENHETAVKTAALPEQIRGYGHVKENNITLAKAQQIELLAEFYNPSPKSDIAAE
jgi:indolepyruvate ferredoxin oxidoreductase